MTGRHAVPALIAALVLLGSSLAPAGAEAQDRDPDEEEPILSPPTARHPEEDPTIAELEDAMVPTLVLPELRVRVGGGIGIQTAGASLLYGRIHQEVEWQPPALQFVLLGIGAAQSIAGAVLYQIGARIGGHAWFCEDAVVRCQGAITLQLGYVGGSGGEGFDFSADADLRFLFVKTVEVFVRGGFFAVGMASFVNVTAGLAIAF